tara:strand:- start:2035 stop:2247 length:213 start_codon:yes stop_codon:yes gene_type:complete
MSDKLMVVVKQLREKNERLRKENERLRSLVREAYAEGFNDGGLAAHPMNPSIDWEDSWRASASREELGDE